MEPLLIILVPGLFGGLVLALLIAGHRQGTPSTFVPRRLAAPSPALINMAHIRVEGVGGLGMVAAGVAVAVSDPRIRLAMIVASVLGAGLALVLIAMRRRTGALSSSGDGPDGRSPLRIDGERRRAHLARCAGNNRPGRTSREGEMLRASAEISTQIWPPMRPGWRRCSSLTYSRYARSSRLAIRAPRCPYLRTYFCAGP